MASSCLKKVTSSSETCVIPSVGTSSTLKIVMKPVAVNSPYVNSWTLTVSLDSCKQTDGTWVTTFEACKESSSESQSINLEVLHSISDNKNKQSIKIQEVISDQDLTVKEEMTPAKHDTGEGSSKASNDDTLADTPAKLEIDSKSASSNLLQGEISTQSTVSSNDQLDVPINFSRVKCSETLQMAPWFVTRSLWGAEDPKCEMNPISHPVKYVIIGDKGMVRTCSYKDCLSGIQGEQNSDMSRGEVDILSNFYIGVDGRVYEGRGWDLETGDDFANGFYFECGWECSLTISISFMNYFHWNKFSSKEEKALNKLIKIGVELGKIACDYKLLYINSATRNLKSAARQMEHFQKNEEE